MGTVGPRELRQHALALLRRAEAGEEITITITVAGRPAIRLISAAPRRWRDWSEVAEVFHGPADPDWTTDRDRVDDQLRDPWTGA